MADELKDQRIPIMMTPSEVKAIDDWMFANRVRSRGEAIRRLCAMGLEIGPLFELGVKDWTRAIHLAMDLAIDLRESPDMEVNHDRISDLVFAVGDCGTVPSRLGALFSTMVTNDTFEKAKTEFGEYLQKFNRSDDEPRSDENRSMPKRRRNIDMKS